MAFGDKYALEVPLGESELGTVWAAKETANGRKVVIAVLEEDAPDALKAHLLALGGVLSGFTHPNVVRVFEAGTNDEGAPYLVMERLEGTSLSKRWEASPALRADRTLEIGIGIVDGLTKLHELKLPGGEPVVHGDVEPGNVILVGAPGKEVPKLIGFVLNRSAKRNDPGSRVSLATMQPLAYAAPEQASGAVTSSASADLYSAAAILFAGLTGRPPHVGSDAGSLADAIAKEAAPLFTSLRKDLTPFAATMDRALSVDPKRRYADGGALGRALRTALAMGRMVGSKETPVGKRSAIAGEGASSATIPGSTRSPSRMPPRPAEAKPTPRGLAPPSKPTAEPKASETGAKPSDEAAKPSEAAAKPSDEAAKASEATAKASEAATQVSDEAAKGSPGQPKASVVVAKGSPGQPKASVVAAKAPEVVEKASDLTTKPSDEAAKASDEDDMDGLPSSELELVSAETSLPPTPPKAPSMRPPPTPTEARGSIPELASGELELEPSKSDEPKARPAPPRTPTKAEPAPKAEPEAVEAKKPEAPEAEARPQATAGRFAPPAASNAPPSPQSVVEAARAVDGWIALPEPARAEAPAPPAPSAAPPPPPPPPAPSPSISDLADEEPAEGELGVRPLEPSDELGTDDELALGAANGPPRWLLVALSVTVVLLGGILAWMRLGQAPSTAPTESLGAILDDDPPPSIAPPTIAPATIAPATSAPATSAPATTLAPPVTTPPITAPPATTIAPPVTAPPPPPATTIAPPATTSPPRVSATEGTSGTRSAGTTTSSTRTASSSTTGSRTGSGGATGSRTTGSRTTGSRTSTGMTTASTGMSTGRTTVVTDPGF